MQQPASAVVGIDDIQRLTNKSISGVLNTLTNIPSSALAAGIDAEKIANGTVNNTHFQHLAGTRNIIQAQIDGKSDVGHTHVAADILAGPLDDSLISRSSVVQHQSAISISALLGAPTSAVVGVNSTMTLTNKTLSGASNTLTDVSNGSLLAGIDAAKLGNGTVTNENFQYLAGATSNIQAQINTKAGSTHTHAASDIVSGTLADARISLSSIAQHVGSLSISTLSGAPSSQVVGVTDTQTLTHKTLDSATNTVMATKLKTVSGSVVIGGATQPVNGQVLTALGDGTANWLTPGTGAGTVTSVSLSVPSEFTVSSSPVTGTGTLGFTKATQNPALVYAGPSTDIAIGASTIKDTDDTGNGGLLFATSYTLSQTATVKALGFYVTAAVGDLRLGLYSHNDSNPHLLLAGTESFTPVVGWNTIPVTSPVQLNAGTYWLSYLIQSNGLHSRKSINTGNSRYYAYAFGALPGNWTIAGQSSSTSESNIVAHFTIAGSSTAPVFRGLTYSDIPDLTRAYCDLKSAQNLKNKSLASDSVWFADSTDSSKRISFSSAFNSSNSVLTIATQQTLSRILTIPNLSANDTMLTAGTTQTISGIKSFQNVAMITSGTLTYTTGTALQNSTTITGNGTAFTQAMVGGLLVFNNGAYAFVLSCSSSTSLTVGASQTVAEQGYTLYYGGYQQTSSGNTSSTRTVINPTNPAHTPFTVWGASSQASSLTEWKSSTGSVLARVTSAGDYDTGSFAGRYCLNGEPVLAMPNSTSVLVGDTNNAAGVNLGVNNTFLGVNAGRSVTSGHDHTLLGYNAGSSLISSGADSCTMVGSNAGYQCTGGNNLFCGKSAGYLVTTGTFNVALGGDSLGYSGGLYTGSYNTLVGQRSVLSAPNADNACVFGYNASAGNGGLAFGSSSTAGANELAIRAGNGVYLLKATESTLTLPSTTSTLTLGTNVLTFPSATDTLTGLNAVQTITNKTLTSNTNDVRARGLWVGSGSGFVSTYAAVAPTSGQILKATDSGMATWQTVAGMTWRGAWSNIVPYSVSDVVYSTSASWICIASHTNQVPPNGTYWNMLADGFHWRSIWCSAHTYVNNDVVTHNGVIYVCTLGHINKPPPDATFWSVMMTASTASALQTATTQVAISGSAAPSAGQVITASSNTVGAWSDQAPKCIEVSATATTSTSAVSYVQMDTMTVTPPAGTYLVLFSCNALYNSDTGTAKLALHKAGLIVSHTEREFSPKTLTAKTEMSTNAKVTVNGSEVIEIRYLVSVGTFTISGRSLQLLRVT